jgi:uncharacterized membrane protein YgaE (UPF0421/DUF939 family)
MRLTTILKFISICLISTIIFLGIPTIVGLFTLNTDAILLSLFVGGGSAGMFAVYAISYFLRSTVKYCNKKQKEKEAIKNV